MSREKNFKVTVGALLLFISTTNMQELELIQILANTWYFQLLVFLLKHFNRYNNTSFW